MGETGRKRFDLLPASTEPRSFERGDIQPLSHGLPPVSLLQRSRALSSAEMAGHEVEEIGDVYLLQRSRALSSAEITEHAEIFSLPALASTEPRSFERGD